MVELIPTPFADLLERLHVEPRRNGALFELARDKWYVPQVDGPDLAVTFHDQRAGNPVGPAAGPHTQMAQNILLSYLAGGRIMELKTVQVDDRLEIPRPCIDMTNVGYNVEWSQELRIQESLREYATAAMLIHIVRQGDVFGDADLTGSAGEVIYDLSLGYDLEGIRSAPVRTFIEGMLNAGTTIDSLRLQIPSAYARLADLDYPAALSRSVTLSTFHGCPAGEIESICRFLLDEYDLNVVVKMNPPMLGEERLEHLLHDVLGYDEVQVNPKAYASGLSFDEGVDLCRRLADCAEQKGRHVGAKFSNTLEVLNHRDFFGPSNQIMYLSGVPLHVITLTLVDEFRRAVGGDFHISFCAGVDRHNFPATVACCMTPVTTCTDLLKPGGYARLPRYLHALSADMQRLGAGTVEEYVLRRAAETGCQTSNLVEAALHNTRIAAADARNDPRYRRHKNSAVPKRMDSHLEIFDCITCDKCIPVCPNAANFTFPSKPQNLEYTDYRIAPDGVCRPTGQTRTLSIEKERQIANYGDYCNECGNCDTFCPEHGGPFIEKPTFFGSVEALDRCPTHDGFAVSTNATGARIDGRYRGRLYSLDCQHDGGRLTFADEWVEVIFDANHAPVAVTFRQTPPAEGYTLDMRAYHTLRILLEGILDSGRANPINTQVHTDTR